MRNITVRESIVIAASPDRVWDFTQDWSRRPSWDATVISSTPEQGTGGAPAYRVRGAGGLGFVARYKLYERPKRTSLEMAESSSRLVAGGGGSWSYEPEGAATRFTQVNTLTLSAGLIPSLIAPLVRWELGRATRRALKRAKEMIESSHS